MALNMKSALWTHLKFLVPTLWLFVFGELWEFGELDLSGKKLVTRVMACKVLLGSGLHSLPWVLLSVCQDQHSHMYHCCSMVPQNHGH